MTFSGGNSSRHRRRRMAMDVAGHRGRGNEMSRRATARLRPPEPEEPLPIEYTEETRSAVEALALEPVSHGEAANGQASAHADHLASTPAPQPEPPIDQMDQMEPVSHGEAANGQASAHADHLATAPAPQPPMDQMEPVKGNGLALELEPRIEAEKANGGISAEAPEAPVQTLNGNEHELESAETVEPEPVRFKWDPKTGQAVPVT